VVKASGSKIKVVVEVPKEIPVSGSAGQMQQVLVNLVQNAIDSTERQADARLEIRGERRARSAVLTFRDNGTGFREDALGQVFDPFFTTKPVGKGTGLGLSISYGIVERHRGQLAAANHPGGGAVLTLTLPLAG
jgi:two-component system sensor histidine kinase HupT/HoxJ